MPAYGTQRDHSQEICNAQVVCQFSTMKVVGERIDEMMFRDPHHIKGYRNHMVYAPPSPKNPLTLKGM